MTCQKMIFFISTGLIKGRGVCASMITPTLRLFEYLRAFCHKIQFLFFKKKLFSESNFEITFQLAVIEKASGY